MSEPSLSIPTPTPPPRTLSLPPLPERSPTCGHHRRLRAAQIRPAGAAPLENTCTDATRRSPRPPRRGLAPVSCAPALPVAVRGWATPIRPNPVEFTVPWCQIGEFRRVKRGGRRVRVWPAGNGAGDGSRVWFWSFGLRAWRMGAG
jgi:hypothetical protein